MKETTPIIQKRPPIRRTLFVQTNGIGDLILATPALAGVRKTHPDIHLSLLLGSPAATQVLEGSDLCDEQFVLSQNRADLSKDLRTLVALRARRFDAVILATHMSPRWAAFFRGLLRPRILAGDSLSPRRWGYTHWTRQIPHRHRVLANHAIVHLLLPDAPLGRLTFHLDDSARNRAAQLWESSGFAGRSILGIHAGGDPHNPQKRLPPETYGAFLRRLLAHDPESRVALFLGPGDDEYLPAFEALGADPRIVLFRNLPLKTVAALVARTRHFLSGDSALSHVAAAFGVPVTVVAGPTQIDSTRPWGKEHRIIRTREALPCMPCYGTPLWQSCPIDRRCMRSISESAILEGILATPPAPPPQDIEPAARTA